MKQENSRLLEKLGVTSFVGCSDLFTQTLHKILVKFFRS